MRFPLSSSRLAGKALHWVAALLVLFFVAEPVLAEEEIVAYAVTVTLATNGSVRVVETIDVTVEGNAIRRGIYRDIPTVLRRDGGAPLRSDLDVLAVERDGQAEPFSIESIGSGFQRIRIGDADVLLSHGRHRYVIDYAMSRQARNFAEHDELFWNATGNFWVFPIRSAVATVILPDGAVISRAVGYTGSQGSEEQAVTVTRPADNRAVFRATRQLAAGEGLSVAVAFQKGILIPPSGIDGLLFFLSDYRGSILPAIAVLLVLTYYYFAWDSVGRDPTKGTIIPLFHPPKGMSPALLHYIHQMGWKQSGWTAFTASIFDLGVKGLLVIETVGKALKLRVTGREPQTLSPGEGLIYDYLRRKGDMTIGKENGVELNRKRAEFIGALEAENRQIYFKNNVVYTVAGFALSILCLGALVLSGVLDVLWLAVAVIAGIGLGLFTSIFNRLWSGNGFSRFVTIVAALIVGVNLLGGVAVLGALMQIDIAAIAAASIVVVNIVFAILLRAPTVQGRKIMDQIEGFRMYLETAEKNRLNFVGEPQMTVDRFESILPFAIALGVEQPWSKRFEGELARHAVPDADANYRPNWYRGSSFSSTRIANSVTAATAGMSAAMIAAQPASSSSSGFSSGGGGSGGGGGGGGGGGW